MLERGHRGTSRERRADTHSEILSVDKDQSVGCGKFALESSSEGSASSGLKSKEEGKERSEGELEDRSAAAQKD